MVRNSGETKIRVLWFRPSRWKNVSVRRERIREKLELRDVSVELVGATPRNFLSYTIRAMKGEYDVIIGNVRLGLYGGYFVAGVSRTPFIGDVSDTLDDISGLPKPLYFALGRYERFVLKRTDANVFLPETIKEVEGTEIEGEVAGNAVDFEMFSEPSDAVIDETSDILTQQGVNLDSHIAVDIGSLPAGANIGEIIEAARITEDWQFLIVGEGPMEEELQKASEDLDNLFFPGAFEYELMPGFLYHSSAAFCLENIERPLKISEYGAANLPTLGAHGKLEEEFTHDEIFYVDPEPGEISEALMRILENPDEAQRRADNLQEHAKRYSWDEVASTYYEIITSLVENYS
jgi:glycosyltransferase involved in cell wall biosynthesis